MNIRCSILSFCLLHCYTWGMDDLEKMEYRPGSDVAIQIEEPSQTFGVENFGSRESVKHNQVVIEMDELMSDDLERVKQRFNLRSCGYDDALKKELKIARLAAPDSTEDVNLLVPTKGKRRDHGGKDGVNCDKITSAIIGALDKRIVTLDMKIREEIDEKQKLKEAKEEKEKHNVWLKISNVVSWGATCCVGSLTLMGTLAALGFTIAQAVTPK